MAPFVEACQGHAAMVYSGLSFCLITKQAVNLVHLSFGHIIGVSLTKETIRFLKISGN